MPSLHGIYDYFCPNCNNSSEDRRNFIQYPCPVCLPEIKKLEDKKSIAKELEIHSALKQYADLIELEEKLEDYSKIFKKLIYSEPWSIQRTWIKRIFMGKSFTALAPTGIGKTTFGIITALYLAKKEEKKSLIICPNSVLLADVFQKLTLFQEEIKAKNIRILSYISAKMTPKRKKEFDKIVEEGDFHILIVTNQFLSKKFKILEKHFFDFVFADDTDSLLKTSSNIDRILKLIGFNQEDLSKAFDYIKSSFKYSRNSEDDAFVESHKELKDNVISIKNSKKIGSLVISTATGKGRGMRPKLFKALLSFDIGGKVEGSGKVADLILEEESEKALIDSVNKLGKRGGLIFVPISKGQAYAEKLVEILQTAKIRAALALSGKMASLIRDLKEGKIDVLVGVSTHYGLLVRGLDLPETIRYAIFYGIPHFKFPINMEGEPNSFQLIRLLGALSYVLEGKDKEKVEKQLKTLKKNYFSKKVVEHSFHLAKEYYVQPAIIQALKESEEVIFKEENGGSFMLIPDVPTYIQASGRTSRLFLDGFTQGISLILESDKRMIRLLAQRLKWLEDREIKNIAEVSLDTLVQEVEQDRNKVRELKEQKKSKKIVDKTQTVLMIVESPTKAGLISHLIGKPSLRYFKNAIAYEVTMGKINLIIISSMGHVYDLTTAEKGFYGVEKLGEQFFIGHYSTIKSCKKCRKQFTYPYDKCPKCGSPDFYDKKDLVEDLKEIAKEVDAVFISTDPDAEGEKIGWDIAGLLSPYVKEVKRIAFHEVTKRGIAEAFRNISILNENLVESQLVRRIQDRWIGFEFSRILKEEFNEFNISAGRVQTPVLGAIIDRMEEYKKTKKKYYSVKTADFYVEFLREEVGKLPKKVFLSIPKIEETEEEITPSAPFTTDTLLTEANRRYNMPVLKIMELAQELFENGLISYHRTDSTHVSTFGQRLAKEYVTENIGLEYLQNRSWGEEGAHECIRPTRPIAVKELRELIFAGDLFVATQMTNAHFMLYDLIFKRFIASQMRNAKVKKQKIHICFGKAKMEMERKVEILQEGFHKVTPIYLEKPLSVNKKIEILEMKKTIRPDKKLYSQADVIELMKKKGLGRPSTYSQILATLISRGYVIEVKYGRLIATKKGMSVYAFLNQNYNAIFSENRTKELEKIMKEIEEGKTDYQNFILGIHQEIMAHTQKTV